MKKERPKVSIIIPVYNGSNFLREAIDSALAQTYDNIEVIVVNDGSNDGDATEKIAQSYGDKIRYFQKENGGVASALNFGIEKMHGSYFSWLSHDDIYEKTKVEDQINLTELIQSDEVIVACNARVLFPNGILKKTFINKSTFDYFDIFLATSALVGVNGCSLLIPKKALDDSGGFDISLPVTQDYDLWFRLNDKYKFVLLEKHLIISRVHDMQGSVQYQELMIISGDRLHYGFLKNIPYRQFEKYFCDSKANVKHIMDNYQQYKKRGYKKTASMILRNVLRFYNKNDIENFYKVFNNELNSLLPNKRSRNFNRDIIDQEYIKLIRSTAKELPIIAPAEVTRNDILGTKKPCLIRRGLDSLARDGAFLTMEKIARKFCAIVTRK